jgi:hypothetical protein
VSQYSRLLHLVLQHKIVIGVWVAVVCTPRRVREQSPCGAGLPRYTMQNLYQTFSMTGPTPRLPDNKTTRKTEGWTVGR